MTGPRLPPKPAVVPQNIWKNPLPAVPTTVPVPGAKVWQPGTLPPPAQPAKGSSTTQPLPLPSGSQLPIPTEPAKQSPKQGEVDGSDKKGTVASRAELKQEWDEEEVINAILRGDFFEGNPSNYFNNLTFNWRLFAMADEDFLYEGDVPTDIKEYYARLDGRKQVVIAQSGVTGYTITEVEMTSVFGDADIRSSQSTEITMKIVEPNGVSFLDGLKAAAEEAGVLNYLDFFYYLELTFKGYEDGSGEIAFNPFSEYLPNGGRWIWGVKINDIDVSLGSGGGEYRLTMLPMSDVALDAEFANAPDTMIVPGKTVGEFFTNLTKSINRAWNRRLVIPEDQEGFISHKFQIHGMPANGVEPQSAEENLDEYADALATRGLDGLNTDGPNVVNEEAAQVAGGQRAELIAATGITEQQISDMKLEPQNTDWNNIRTHQAFAIVKPDRSATDENGQPRNTTEFPDKETENVPTANIGKGTPIVTIIEQIMACCEEAQSLAVDAFGNNSPDESKDLVNSKGFRECLTWQIIPEVQFNKKDDLKYDFYTNRYGRTIIWHIYPRIDQEPILSYRQIVAASDSKTAEEVQKKSLASIAARGLLPKRYDYLFTGLNTEVLNFDINFNFAWQVQLPRFQNYYHDQGLQHTLVNRIALLDQLDANYDRQYQELRARSSAHDQTEGQDSHSEEEHVELLRQQQELAKIGKSYQETFAQAQQERANAEARAREIYGNILSNPPEQDSTREYIESILDDRRRTDEKPERPTRLPMVPLSFTGADEAKQESGYGGTGQWHNGRQLFGAVLNQVYGPVTGRFQQIDLQIRGDPFWLGAGTFEKAIQHKYNTVENSKTQLYTNVGNNHLLFRFKYPTDVDDSGTIVLKDNETVTGCYKVNRVKNTFKGGQFTQNLEAIRLPLIDLFVSLYGLKTTDDSEAQEKPKTQAERDATRDITDAEDNG